MKARKILDGTTVQGWKIEKPTKGFKKMFPKNYILSIDVMGRHFVYNTDVLPSQFTITPPIGYIFTYSNTLPRWLDSKQVKYKDVGGSYPACLDKYFTGSDANVILSCVPKNRIVPPKFVTDIVIQCKAADMLSPNIEVGALSNGNISGQIKGGGGVEDVRDDVTSDDDDDGNNASDDVRDDVGNNVRDDVTSDDDGNGVRDDVGNNVRDDVGNDVGFDLCEDIKTDMMNANELNTHLSGGSGRRQKKVKGGNVNESAEALRRNIMAILKQWLKADDYSVEEWAKDVIYNYPTNINGLPVKYPKEVDAESLKTTNIDPLAVFVEYDLRADSYELENKFITAIEDAFDDPEAAVTVYNTYNNILPDICASLDKRKLKYTKLTDDSIEVKAKYLRDLDVKFQFTDFI